MFVLNLDAGDGVPHPAQVPDRDKYRYEQLLREVVDVLREFVGAVVIERGGERSASSAAGVECRGYASFRFAIVRCFDACRRAQIFRCFAFAKSLRAKSDSLASLERLQSGKESEGDGEKTEFCFFSFRWGRWTKTRRKKSGKTKQKNKTKTQSEGESARCVAPVLFSPLIHITREIP